MLQFDSNFQLSTISQLFYACFLTPSEINLRKFDQKSSSMLLVHQDPALFPLFFPPTSAKGHYLMFVPTI